MEVPVSISRITPDGKYIYSFAKYYNELLITDLSTFEIRSLGAIKDELDIPDLIFDIIIYSKWILLVPRNAKYFHVIDTTNNSEILMDADSIVPGVSHSQSSYFSMVYGQSAYIFSRWCSVAYKYDFITRCWSTVFDEKIGDYTGISSFATEKEKMLLLNNSGDGIFLRNVEEQSSKYIKLNQYLHGCNRIYIIDNAIWVYHDKKGILAKIDEEGEIIKEYTINFKMKGQSPALRCYEDVIYFYANQLGEVRIIKNDDSVEEYNLNINSKKYIYWLLDGRKILYGNEINNGHMDIEKLSCITNNCHYMLLSTDIITGKIDVFRMNMSKRTFVENARLVMESNQLNIKDFIKVIKN